jgi:hypothetical protein
MEPASTDVGESDPARERDLDGPGWMNEQAVMVQRRSERDAMGLAMEGCANSERDVLRRCPRAELAEWARSVDAPCNAVQEARIDQATHEIGRRLCREAKALTDLSGRDALTFVSSEIVEKT